MISIDSIGILPLSTLPQAASNPLGVRLGFGIVELIEVKMLRSGNKLHLFLTAPVVNRFALKLDRFAEALNHVRFFEYRTQGPAMGTPPVSSGWFVAPGFSPALFSYFSKPGGGRNWGRRRPAPVLSEEEWKRMATNISLNPLPWLEHGHALWPGEGSFSPPPKIPPALSKWSS